MISLKELFCRIISAIKGVVFAYRVERAQKRVKESDKKFEEGLTMRSLE